MSPSPQCQASSVASTAIPMGAPGACWASATPPSVALNSAPTSSGDLRRLEEVKTQDVKRVGQLEPGCFCWIWSSKKSQMMIGWAPPTPVQTKWWQTLSNPVGLLPHLVSSGKSDLTKNAVGLNSGLRCGSVQLSLSVVSLQLQLQSSPNPFPYSNSCHSHGPPWPTMAHHGPAPQMSTAHCTT